MPGFRRLWSWELIFVVHALTASGGPARAQQAAQPGREKLALAEVVELAVKSTRLLDSQDARVQESRLAASQARVWPGLTMEFLAGRRRETSASGSRYELALAQPLPFLGKPGLKGALLDLQSESWMLRRTAARLAVTLSVVQLAYEYTVNGRKAGFIERRQKRFELIHEYIAGRVFPTPQRKAESRIVQNRLTGLASEALRSQAQFKSSFERLKAYAPLAPGRYPDIAVPWLSGSKPVAEGEWTAKALAHNPDLRSQRLAVKGAEVDRALAFRDGLPDPSVVASYEEGRAGETERNYGLGLSLALPPWNRNRAGIESAEAKRSAEERLLAFEEARLKAELARLVVEYEAARGIVQKYPESLLPEVEAQLKEAEEGFRKGQLDLLTFLELDASASETFGLVLDAQRDLAAKGAELLAAAGEQDALAQFGSF